MLRISLRDGETLVINGALLRAKGRAELLIENHVALLRGREIMAREDATSTARHLYFETMMAYLGDNPEEHQAQVITAIQRLLPSLTDLSAQAACVRFARLVAEGDYYRALGVCRTLIAFEDALQPTAAA